MPRPVRWTLLLLLVASAAGAHPGSGLEVAADESIYFSDIFRETIWCISPDGSLWLLDRNRVRILTADGFVTTHGRSLIESDPAAPPFREAPDTTWNRLYGLAVGRNGTA